MRTNAGMVLSHLCGSHTIGLQGHGLSHGWKPWASRRSDAPERMNDYASCETSKLYFYREQIPSYATKSIGTERLPCSS